LGGEQGNLTLFSAERGVLMFQAGDFNLVNMAAYAIFSAIGFVAFIYGKRRALWRPMIIGIALMAYPYFFSATLIIYLIGIILTAALYFWRE
jgi:hypothetical protein